MILLEAARLHVKFVRTWLKDFPWLTNDVEANQMFCKLCRDNTTCAGAGCWTLNCRPAQVLLGSCLLSSGKFIIVL